MYTFFYNPIRTILNHIMAITQSLVTAQWLNGKKYRSVNLNR